MCPPLHFVGFYISVLDFILLPYKWHKRMRLFSRMTLISLGTASMLSGMIQKLPLYEPIFYSIIKWMEQSNL